MKSKIIEADIDKVYLEFANYLPRLEGLKVLITGGNGFLGGYVVDFFVRANLNLNSSCEITVINKNKVLSDSRLGHLINDSNVRLLTGDIGKEIRIEGKFDIIIHAASRATVMSNFEDPIDTIDANVNGLRTLLEHASRHPVKEFLFFSSGDIYGNPLREFIPTPETYPGNVDCLDKKACYFESKRLGETMCMDFFRKRGVPIKILRIFNTYGPGLRKDGKVIAEFFEDGLNEKKISIKSSGNEKRSFCYISDFLRGFLVSLFNGYPGEAYNIGDDKNNVSIRELAHLVRDVIGEEVIVETGLQIEEVKSIFLKTRYPNIEKIKKIGFEPKIELVEGLKRFYEWRNEK